MTKLFMVWCRGSVFGVAGDRTSHAVSFLIPAAIARFQGAAHLLDVKKHAPRQSYARYAVSPLLLA
jgi:hypothetical protein